MTPEYEFASDSIEDHYYRFAKEDAVFLTENPKPKPKPPAPKPKPEEGSGTPPAGGAAPEPAGA